MIKMVSSRNRATETLNLSYPLLLFLSHNPPMKVDTSIIDNGNYYVYMFKIWIKEKFNI